MVLSLDKGESLNLNKASDETLKYINICLGWSESNSSNTADLDAFAILLNKDQTLEKLTDVVYYCRLLGEGVEHLGDDLFGGGAADEDNETIKISLDKLEPHVKYIDLAINIYAAVSKKQNFGQIKNAFARVSNAETEQELCYYKLSDSDYDNDLSVIVARLYKEDGDWHLKAIGEGYQADISNYIENHKSTKPYVDRDPLFEEDDDDDDIEEIVEEHHSIFDGVKKIFHKIGL